MKVLRHLHIMLMAKVQNPTALGLEGLKEWTRQVVEAQDLEPVIGPHAVYVGDLGNEGPTGGVHIKTSHMAWHIWDRTGMIQADLYTCGDLDIDKFMEAFTVFSPEYINAQAIDREKDFKVIYKKTLIYPTGKLYT